jgi:integrase
VSRPYATDEQYERWYIGECCRCGRRRHKAGSWPDGHVCRTCSDRAVQTRGTCPGCGQERALPGLRPGDGAAICTSCAGFSRSVACSRCGFEGKLHGGRLCTRCALADRLAEVLDDGRGRIRPELVPLADSLLAMDNPLSGLTWLYRRRDRTGSASDLLRRLARGEAELTHEGLRALQPWRAAAHLRDLLMACGVLPAIDRQVCGFERWLAIHIEGLADERHAQVVRRFATWEVLTRLRAQAEKKPISTAARRHADEQVKRATAFLGWLSGRGLSLRDCRQADIDAWHAENNQAARHVTRSFLQWCMTTGLSGRFQLPGSEAGHTAPMPDEERITHLGRVLTAGDLPLRTRAAAAIVLLYAQPASRIVRLTLDDVIRDGGEVLLRLGEPPSPVPEPAAGLLTDWISSRTNMRTATNRDSRWLFPGRRAGQPMGPDYLTALIRGIGIPTTAGRASAIRQQVLEMPSPVVADALGYHPVTTARLAAQAAATFSRYAPGDHARPSPVRKPGKGKP